MLVVLCLRSMGLAQCNFDVASSCQNKLRSQGGKSLVKLGYRHIQLVDTDSFTLLWHLASLFLFLILSCIKTVSAFAGNSFALVLKE